MSGDPRAYAAKPSQLANPVPGVAEQGSLDSFMASQKIPNAAPAQGAPAPAAAAPQAPAAAPAPAGDGSLDSFLSQSGAAPQAPGAPQLPQQGAADDHVQRPLYSYDPNQGPIDQITGAVKQLRDLFELPRGEMVKKIRENIASGDGDGGSKWLANTLLNNTAGIPDQLHNYAAGSRANVGRSQFEKQSILEKQVGKENVQVSSDGAISFRYPGEKDFRPLSPPGFELLGDTAGNPRQLFKEALVDPPSLIVGGALGPGAALATRAALQTPANMLLDKYAETVEDAKHDQNRSRLVENLVDTGVEAASGVMVTMIKRAIPGTDEAQKLAARKAINEVDLSRQAADVATDAAHVTNSGMFQTVDGGIVDPSLKGQKITLRADQLFQNDPSVMRKTQLVKDSAPFQNVQNAQVNNVVDATKNIFAKISQYTGEEPEAIAEGLRSTVAGINQAEGQTIGSFRAKAMAQLGNEKLPVPQEIQQQAASMMQELGFTVAQSADGKAISYVPPKDLRPLMGKFGITKMGDMRSFINTLQDYAQTSGTGLRIDEIDRLVNTVGNLNGVAGRNGGQVAAAWGQFSGSLRQFRRDAIGAGLVNDVDIRGFNAAMDKFGSLRDASNTLSRVLDDDFTSNAVVQQVFNKGQAGLENLRAIKTLVAQDAPQTWAGLKQAWFDDMLRRYSTPSGKTPFNFAGMQKELGSYGKTFLDEAFEGSGVSRQDVTALMNVAQNVQSTYRAAGTPIGLDEKAKQGLFNSLVGALGGMHFKVVNGLQQALGVGIPGNPLNEVLNPKDIATRLAKYNGAGDKLVIEDNLKKIIATSAIARSIPQALRTADIMTRNATKRALEPAGTPAQAPEEP